MFSFYIRINIDYLVLINIIIAIIIFVMVKDVLLILKLFVKNKPYFVFLL